ncbi:MAG TPA: SxtJ family membrane protein [Pirellulales bacterium]|jgi:hypothetical protein
MKLVEMEWNPSERQLRQFGWIALVGLPLAGWLFAGKPWPISSATTMQTIVIAGLAIAGALCAALAATRPRFLRTPFVVAMLLALPVGMIVSELILAAIYFLVFAPVALFFKLIGRDALEQRLDRQATTYWRPKAQPNGVESYFRQS